MPENTKTKIVRTKEEIAERRARREARREKQRAANVGRAEKMHKARLAFEAEPALLKKKQNKLPQFVVGCSGWFYWHWRGRFYPEDSKTNEWFNFYADHFNTVELNAPFYSWPTIATVNSWIKQAGERAFIYTVKVSELITHTKKFEGTKTLVKDFGLIADMLPDHMGCFLYQLPPSFHYSPARLKDIISQLDHTRRNVVEFRHASWWNDEVYDAFRENGTIFCSCSGPKLPDELVVTSEEVYVRFHGPERWYRHDYTKEQLMEWVQRIRDHKVKRVWAYFNNDMEAHAIKNAELFLKLLKKK